MNTFDHLKMFYALPLEAYNRIMGTNLELASGEAYLYAKDSDFPYDQITVENSGTWSIKGHLDKMISNGNNMANMNSSFYLVVSGLEDIKDSIPNCKVDLSVLTEKPKKEKSKLSLDEAKKLYPEWYQERVVEGRPKKKGTWVCNEALYEWWKNKIFTEVKVGGRYFSIMALCAYGLKCGISERRIRQDAYSFLEHLESLTDDEDNHFTREDVKDALKALKADNKLLSTMASREWIEKQTKVVIPPNKRNGRKQATHLKIARFTLETMNEDRGKALQGRPDKAKIVEEWQRQHPDGKKADCIRETGLSKPTVYKWWK